MHEQYLAAAQEARQQDATTEVSPNLGVQLGLASFDNLHGPLQVRKGIASVSYGYGLVLHS